MIITRSTNLLIGLLYLVGCTNASSGLDSDARNSADSAALFYMDYPQWEEKRSNDRLNVVSRIRADRQCYFDLNVANAPIKDYSEIVQDYMEKRGAKILTTNPLSYSFTIPDGNYDFVAKTSAMYCENKTYLATITCLDQNFDIATTSRIFNSMRCADKRVTVDIEDTTAPPVIKAEIETTPLKARVTPPPVENPRLGMVVSQQGQFNHENVVNAYRLARQSGVQLARHYVAWTDIEKKKDNWNWKGNDYVIEIVRDSGLKVSVAFHTIRTAIRGPVPADLKFKDWNDPVLIERFSNFVLAFLDRYGDVVDYIEIGSEVNAYFARHPQEIESYRVFFDSVYWKIKENYPRVSIGIVFAYHEMKENNNYSAYNRLSIGDHDAFTLYLFGDNFAHDRNPREVLENLQEISRLTGNRHFALEEVGWSPWPGLEGTEGDQREAVGYFFDFLEQAPDRLEFMNWYILHDGRDRDCQKIARTFTKKGDAVSRNDEALSLFADFLCHFGLRENSGNPRAAWHEWIKRAEEHNAKTSQQ